MSLLRCKHQGRDPLANDVTVTRARPSRDDDSNASWGWMGAAALIGSAVLAFVIIYTRSFGFETLDAVHLLRSGSIWSDTSAYSNLVRLRVAALQAEEHADLTCPLPFQRHKVNDIRRRISWPYTLGGRREPECKTCGTNQAKLCLLHNRFIQRKTLEHDAFAGQHDFLLSTPCDLWHHVRGRSTFLLGDSQMLDFYKAMICNLREFMDTDAGPSTPPNRMRHGLFGLGRPISSNKTQADWFYHNRAANLAPNCVHFMNSTRVCYLRYNKVQEVEDQFSELERLVEPKDVTIINFGLHHNGTDLASRLKPVMSRLKRSPRLGPN
eukprot:scaffold94638_cov40-Prasinocladus_malaysianus.AAC.1